MAEIVDLRLAPPAYGLRDPLLRGESFAEKRWSRMPAVYSRDSAGNASYLEAAGRAYDASTSSSFAQATIALTEAQQPGDGWRTIAWPWAARV